MAVNLSWTWWVLWSTQDLLKMESEKGFSLQTKLINFIIFWYNLIKNVSDLPTASDNNEQFIYLIKAI